MKSQYEIGEKILVYRLSLFHGIFPFNRNHIGTIIGTKEEEAVEDYMSMKYKHIYHTIEMINGK